MARPKVKAKGYPRRAPENVMFTVAEVNQKSPHICAICEEGGELVICDGPCHRQFHPSVDSDGTSDYQCPFINFPKGKQSGFHVEIAGKGKPCALVVTLWGWNPQRSGSVLLMIVFVGIVIPVWYLRQYLATCTSARLAVWVLLEMALS